MNSNTIITKPISLWKSSISSGPYTYILNNIKNGNIIENGPIINTPNNFTIDLKLHQKRMLYEMIQKENINNRISSGINMFVLADQQGSGKSIEILSLIAEKPIINNINISNKLMFNSNNHIGFTIKPTIQFKSNLIIVPYYLFKQWDFYINKFTKLSCLKINSKKIINQINFTDIVNNKYDIILIKSTLYKYFFDIIYKIYPYIQKNEENPFISDSKELNEIKNNLLQIHCSIRDKNYKQTFLNDLINLKENINKLNIDKLKNNIFNFSNFNLKKIIIYKGPIFERIIYDSCDTININANIKIYGKINWFIPNFIDNLFYPKKLKNGFIKNIFLLNSGYKMINSIQNIYLSNMKTLIAKSYKFKINTFKYANSKKLNLYFDILKKKKNFNKILYACDNDNIKIIYQYFNNLCYIQNLTNKFCNNYNKSDLLYTIKKKENLLKKLTDKKKILKKKVNNIIKEQSNLEKIIDKSLINEEKLIYENELINNTNLYKNISQSINKKNKDIIKLDLFYSKIKNIQENYNTIKCPICSLNCNKAIIVSCCYNLFCLKCFLLNLKHCKKQCPLCRYKPELEDITLITNKKIINKKLLSKSQIYKKLIKKAKNKIITVYNNSCGDILKILNENDISYKFLHNNNKKNIYSIINDFNKNKVQILLLDNKNINFFGINISTTKHLIFYDDTSEYNKKIIITFIQKIGNTNQKILNIHNL